MLTRRIVLASASPRRRELLELDRPRVRGHAGGDRRVALPRRAAARARRRVARAKARAVGDPGEVVLAADTVVVIDGASSASRATPADAGGMLGAAPGPRAPGADRRRVARGGEDGDSADRVAAAVEESAVRLRPLTPTRSRGTSAPASRPTRPAPTRCRVSAGCSSVAVSGSSSNVIGLPLSS